MEKVRIQVVFTVTTKDLVKSKQKKGIKWLVNCVNENY